MKRLISWHTFGYIGSILAIFMLTPQLIQVLQTSETKDLSPWTLLLFFTQSCCWMIYGTKAVKSPPIVITNIFIAFQSLALLVMKFMYG